MALRSVISSRIPLVIILGATGTGKTKLGVELAQKFATEIISADSMQIYKGLDVVTAKATVQERELAKHHLLDILEPHQMFTVVDFRNRALKIIDNLIDQGKLPTVVGGTVYYIESIVYKILVENDDDVLTLLADKTRKRRIEDKETEIIGKKGDRDNLKDNLRDEDHVTTSKDETSPIASEHDKTETESPKASESITATDSLKAADDATTSTGQSEEELREELKELFVDESKFTNEEVHEKLKKVDPDMATRHHPNNRRKILRSIEVWLKSGRRHSEILAEQKLSEGQLRRPDSTIIFWLKCQQDVHEERLNSRVDAMLKDGLIDELLDFHARHNQHRIQDGNPPDYTKGVFQTLGFKEFHEYLMLTSEERNSENGAKLLQASVENMKLATRRFARRQNKMIRGRFLDHPNRQVPAIYELDTTDVSKWDELVKNKAIHIIESFINNSICDFEPLKSNITDERKQCNRNSYNFCDVCQRIFIGDNVYSVHMKSLRHMRALKRKNMLVKNEQKDSDTTTTNSDKITKVLEENKKKDNDSTTKTNDNITKMSETSTNVTTKTTISDERKCDKYSFNFCDVCQKLFKGDNVFAVHLKSYKHMKALKIKKMLEENKQKDSDSTKKNSDKITKMSETE